MGCGSSTVSNGKEKISESLKNVTLHYFPLNGRALLPRMILYHSKVNFENKQIPFDKWPQIQQTMELKFVPQLEINGVVYSQQHTICLVLAKKIGGLLGTTNEDEFQINWLFNCTNDINTYISKLAKPGEEDKDPLVAKRNLDDAVDCVSLFLSVIQNKYVANKEGKFFLGDQLSLADFWLVSIVGFFILNFLGKQLGDVAKKSGPKVVGLVNRLYKEEPFKSFFESELYIKGSF